MDSPSQFIGNGVPLSKIGAYVTETIANNLIFRGVVFSVAKRFTIPASGVVDIVIDPLAVPAECFLVFFPLVFKAFGAGPVYIDIYFGGNIADDGTVIESFNRDTESAVTADTVARLNPTVTTTGDKLPIEFVIHSDGVPATASIGGEQVDDLPFNSRKDGKYLIRLTNQEASPADAWFGANWFEL